MYYVFNWKILFKERSFLNNKHKLEFIILNG